MVHFVKAPKRTSKAQAELDGQLIANNCAETHMHCLERKAEFLAALTTLALAGAAWLAQRPTAATPAGGSPQKP